MRKNYQKQTGLLILLFAVCPVLLSELPCKEVIKKGNYANALLVCGDESKQKNNQDIEVLLSLVEINHELGDEEQEAYYLAKIKNHPKFLEDIEYQYQWYRRVGQKYYFLGGLPSSTNLLTKRVVHRHFGISRSLAK